MTQVPTNRTAASSIAEHTSDHNIFAAQHNELDGHAADTAAHDVDATIAAAIDALVAAAPGTLDTLNELAAALGDDADFAATITTALAGKSATGHGHAESDVTSLVSDLAGKAATGHDHSGTYVPVPAGAPTVGQILSATDDDPLTTDWIDAPSGGGGSPSAIFGDGSDGVVDFDGSTTVLGLVPASGVYTLTSDLFLADGSQVTGTAVVNCANFRLFCNGTFTVATGATVHNDGNPAVGTNGAASIPAGTEPLKPSAGSGQAGAAGSVGTAGASPSLGGGANTSGAPSGGPGIGGGINAISGPLPTTSGLPRSLANAYVSAAAGSTRWSGGSGGAGGTAAANSTGGGGGGGGGVLHLTVYNLVVIGVVRAAGGAAGAATGTGTGAGGGAGGGGGALILVYHTKSGAGSAFTAATNTPGGVGGAPQGAGKTGSAGSNGRVFELVV